MKITIIGLMVIILTSFNTYAGYGEGGFGENEFGNEIPQPTTTTGGGGGGGDGSLSFIDIITQKLLSFINIFTGGGILEYRLLTPREAIMGEQITITNEFENEGDLAFELTCTNAIDLNVDGIISNNEIQNKFSKLAEPKIRNFYNVSINIPSNINEGDYLITGECISGNFTGKAGNKIKIKKEMQTIKEPFIENIKSKYSAYKMILLPVLIIIGLIILFKFGVIQILSGYLSTFIQFMIGMFMTLGIFGLIILAIIIIYLYFKFT